MQEQEDIEMPETIMVTGGLGTVGSYVSRCLVSEGIVPLIVDTSVDNSGIEDVRDKCIVEQCSVLDIPALVSALDHYTPQAIVHLAAIMPEEAQRDPLSALDINLRGTAAVLESARLTSTRRFIYASSRLVYAPVQNQHRHPSYEPVLETHPREPKTYYGKLKRAAEDIVEYYSEHHGLESTILRFGSIFGPLRQGKLRTPSPVDQLVESAIGGRRPPSMSGEHQRDHYCYVGDYGTGIVSSLRRPSEGSGCRAYNIASDIFLSLGEISRVLANRYPGWSPPRFDAEGDPRSMGSGYYFRLGTQKATRYLAFRARFDLSSAVADYEQMLGTFGR